MEACPAYLGDDFSKARVTQEQPTARGDSIGFVLEFLRFNVMEIFEASYTCTHTHTDTKMRLDRWKMFQESVRCPNNVAVKMLNCQFSMLQPLYLKQADAQCPQGPRFKSHLCSPPYHSLPPNSFLSSLSYHIKSKKAFKKPF